MAGNAHQRNVAETAAAKVLKKMGIQPPAVSIDKKSVGPKLERSSFEAYVFFIVAGSYSVMSAFGVPVNFWAGLGMAVSMAAASIHLLWASIWTHNWNRLAKVAGTTIVFFVLLLVVNEGWVQTHQTRNPNTETLSAIQNLSSLVRRITPQVAQNTQIVASTTLPTITAKTPVRHPSDPQAQPPTPAPEPPKDELLASAEKQLVDCKTFLKHYTDNKDGDPDILQFEDAVRSAKRDQSGHSDISGAQTRYEIAVKHFDQRQLKLWKYSYGPEFTNAYAKMIAVRPPAGYKASFYHDPDPPLSAEELKMQCDDMSELILEYKSKLSKPQ